MKTRTILAQALIVLLVVAATGCGQGDKSLDAAGLKLGKDVSSWFGEATKVLGNVHDLESAKAALPQLKEMEGSLDKIASKAAELKPESKEAFVGMVQKALPAFKGAVEKLGSMEGVKETLKPTLDSLLAKVQGLL